LNQRTFAIAHVAVQAGDLVVVAMFAERHSLFIKSRFALLESTALAQLLRQWTEEPHGRSPAGYSQTPER
jgi:hypothetical protein